MNVLLPNMNVTIGWLLWTISTHSDVDDAKHPKHQMQSFNDPSWPVMAKIFKKLLSTENIKIFRSGI